MEDEEESVREKEDAEEAENSDKQEPAGYVAVKALDDGIEGCGEEASEDERDQDGACGLEDCAADKEDEDGEEGVGGIAR